jgi:hypothetical protein
MNANECFVNTNMTHHDLISSYIDNELTAVQEQEFLISLAANDNLRSSFRTELTLKNIVHRDESLITPPRALRASVFAAIGLSAAAAPDAANAASNPVSSSTVVAQSGSFFKTLFATKMNALFTTLSLSVATLVGFVGHDVIVSEPTATQTVQTNNATPSTGNVAAPTQTTSTEIVAEKPEATALKSSSSRVATRITKSPAKSISHGVENPGTDPVTPSTVVPSGTEMESTVTPPQK